MAFNRLLFIISLTVFLLGKNVDAQCTMNIDIPDNERTSQPSKSRSSSKSSKGSKSTRGRLNLDNFVSGCDDADEISIRSPNTLSTYKMKKHGKSPKSSKSGQTFEDKIYMFGDNENGSSMNLLRKPNGQIVGSITDLNEGTVIQISIDDDGGNVVDITFSDDFPPELEAFANPIRERAFLYEKPLYSMKKGNSTERRTNVEETFIIDVMVVWTQKAECAHAMKDVGCLVSSSTQEKMQDLIELAVHETNIAYETSGVNIQLELVYSYRSDYIEPSNNAYSQSVNDLRGNNDGKLDEVHTLREKYGADIVVMLLDDQAYCGIAYLGPHIDFMFSVVNWKCATGHYSFGHEIGHTMGLSHDRGAINNCDLNGYHFGYRDPSGSFRTIMAYNCRVGQCDNIQKNGCSRIQRFSTPDRTFAGKPIGTSRENAARWLNDVASEVSNYYEKKKLCNSVNDCIDHEGDPCYVTSCDDGVCSYTYNDTCNNPANGVCGEDKVWLKVDVQLDNYEQETSWTLTDTCSDEIIISMAGNEGDDKLGTKEFNHRTYSLQKDFICVEKKLYIFTIYDTFGDGICCRHGNGYYSIEYEGMTGNAITGGSFKNKEEHIIDIGSCLLTNVRLTAAPTRTPSKSPTINPTKIPTRSPVSNPPANNLLSTPCFDDREFTFKIDNGTTQKCEWLTMNANQKDNYCSRGHIKGACKASCEFCICTDDLTYSFRLNIGRMVSCPWLVTNSNNIEVRRKRYCFDSDDPESASSDIGNSCIHSCGFCTD